MIGTAPPSTETLVSGVEQDVARTLLVGAWLRVGLAVVVSVGLLVLVYLVVAAVSWNSLLARQWLETLGERAASILTPALVAGSTLVVGLIMETPAWLKGSKRGQ